MERATAVVRRDDVNPSRIIDTVVLDHEGRNRRRVRLTARGGTDVLLDLERPSALDDGDALALEGGRLIRVEAGAQELAEVRADDGRALARLAWHIGNRHTPAEIGPDFIAIERDHVLEAMIVGLGGAITPVVRPFRPERGAYDLGDGGGHRHHDHHHHGDDDHHHHHP
jgi:urease accessory protein